MINIKLERVIKDEKSYQEKLADKKSATLLKEEAHNHWGALKKEDIENNGYISIDIFNNQKSYQDYVSTTIASYDSNTEEQLFKMAKFKFKNKQIITIGNRVIVGSRGIREPEEWRQLGFDIVKYVRANFPNVRYAILNRKVNQKTKQFFEGMYLAEYKFDKYKSKKTIVPDLIMLVSGDLKKGDEIKSRTSIFNVIKEAKQKVNGQFLARNWVNTTPEEANSETISRDIEDKFRNNKNIEVKVYGDEELEALKMNGHLTVNRASKFEARVVRITYTPTDFVKNKDNKVIVGVGKGLTYDSGGLSIKPGNAMTTMKADKGGAMALYGLSDILAKRGGNNKVVLYMAFAENMISPDSYRPDDVVTFRNGVKAHIKNTDAEGRVVIFDSLCLAQDENPDLDEIFSIATLTGAAVYQFGDEAAGMVSKNEKLFDKFFEIGKVEDEIFCEAKLHKFMTDGIDDKVADISNTGTPNQGCQKAGMFLMKAIKKKNIKKYIHLDVAGPTFVEKPFGTNPEHATGFAVRTLFEIYR